MRRSAANNIDRKIGGVEHLSDMRVSEQPSQVNYNKYFNLFFVAIVIIIINIVKKHLTSQIKYIFGKQIIMQHKPTPPFLIYNFCFTKRL